MVTTPLSPLELLHPDGIARHTLVIGSGCPARLRRAIPAPDAECADLVILAPTQAECCARGWLRAAARQTVEQLAPDGLAVALVGRRWRRCLARLLRSHGLRLSPPLVLLPNQASCRHLVPLQFAPLRYALRQLSPTRPWHRRAAIGALRLPGGDQLLAGILPSVSLVAQQPGSRPLWHWLRRYLDRGIQPHNVVMSVNWNGEYVMAVLHCFADAALRPSAVAKLALTMTDVDLADEAGILERLGPGARRAGAAVPVPLSLGRLGDHTALFLTVVDGRPAATLLNEAPRRIFDVVERLVRWLERWNQETRTVKRIEVAWLEREILGPAAMLAPFLQQGPQYLDWLKQRCAAIAGTPVPFVATHNDLSVWNVLIDGRGRLGIVDWETGRDEDVPLVDFFYLITEAVAAVDAYADWRKAFEACFAREGRYAPWVARLQMRLTTALNVPDSLIEFCLHACWIRRLARHHELHPFLSIVEWLATHHAYPGERAEC